jgi:hypothetical protein
VQTFTAGQWFLGGSVWLFDYPNWGLTYQQAVTDFAVIEDHLYLMRTDDRWRYDLAELYRHEREMLVGPVRQSVSVEGGLTVAQQKAIIDQLPAGRYVSLYTFDYAGNPTLQALHPDDPDWVAFFAAFSFTSVVYLDIVP